MNRRTLLAAALAAPSFVFDSAEAFAHEEGLPLEEDLPVETVDVLVVGGGAGGLSAAVSAARAGAGSVLLIEKAAKIGGDTLISGGFFNAVLPERQRPFGIEDGVDLFVSQVLAAGEEENDPTVVRVLAEASGPALLWLESLGMRFLPEPVEIFGSRFRRSFKPIMSRGLGYIRALSAAAYSAGVAVRTRRAVLRFAGDGRGGVVGVVVDSPEGKRLVCARRGVVLASGGFGANRGMISRYAPRVASFPIDSCPGSTGEMIVAAAEAGALLVNMTSVECVPGSREGIPYPIRLDYIPSRMIMVDAAGRRFVEENGSRAEIAAAILAKGPNPCWAIADAATVAAFDAISQKNIYRGLYAGEAFREATPEALARRIGLDREAFTRTLAADPARSRIASPPFWAVRMHLRVHSTLGGVRIDDAARVVGSDGEVLERLWACGACTGSVHGRSRIGGNGINTAVVFGRIAGEAAARAERRLF